MVRRSPVAPEIKEWADDHNQVHELADKLESVVNPTDQSYLWQCLVQGWVEKCADEARLEPRLDLDHLSNL